MAMVASPSLVEVRKKRTNLLGLGPSFLPPPPVLEPAPVELDDEAAAAGTGVLAALGATGGVAAAVR